MLSKVKIFFMENYKIIIICLVCVIGLSSISFDLLQIILSIKNSTNISNSFVIVNIVFIAINIILLTLVVIFYYRYKHKIYSSDKNKAIEKFDKKVKKNI